MQFAIRRARAVVVAGSLGLLVSGPFAPARHPQGVPLGVELQANTHTIGKQSLPKVAAAADGSFVVVWESYGQDEPDAGTFARRFDAAGSPLTGELQVSTYTDSFQYRPTIAMDGAPLSPAMPSARTAPAVTPARSRPTSRVSARRSTSTATVATPER